MCGREPQRAQRRQENSRNGYRPRSLKTAVWRTQASGTAPTTPRACSRDGRASPVASIRVSSAWRQSWAYPRCRARRSRASAPTSTPRWRSSAAATCRARRAATCGSTPNMSCRVGLSVVSQGVVTFSGWAPTGANFLGCDVVDTESEDSWAAFLGGLRERRLAGVSWSPTARRARGRRLAPVPGLRLAALRDAPAAQPPERLLGQARERRPSGTSCTPRSTRTTPTSRAACGPRRRPGWRRCPPGPAKQAEDSTLAFTAFPRAHWAKLRTNNVQERANREIEAPLQGRAVLPLSRCCA